MNKKDYLSIGEFAKLSGIQRKNLIYYDTIKLFSPEIKLDNGYRYYNYRQLYSVSMILALKEIGMPLKDIQTKMGNRTPKVMIELFNEQKAKVDDEINKLNQIKAMMEMHIKFMEESQQIKLNMIEIVDCEKEPIFIGPETTFDKNARMSKEISRFFKYGKEHGIHYSYPRGMFISKNSVTHGLWADLTHFYYHMPKSKFYKPAGKYAVYYNKGDYTTYELSIAKVLRYMEKHHLKYGDVYIDFILNEVSEDSPDSFLTKIAIQIL